MQLRGCIPHISPACVGAVTRALPRVMRLHPPVLIMRVPKHQLGSTRNVGWCTLPSDRANRSVIFHEVRVPIE